MSFSSDIRASVLNRRQKNRCCRRSFSMGLLAGGAVRDGAALRFTVGDGETAEQVASLLRESYPCGKPSEAVKSNSFLWFVYVYAPSAGRYIDALDGESPVSALDPRCKDCRAAFLRGIFAIAGRVTDPTKGYHLEFASTGRTDRLCRVFEEIGLSLRPARRYGEELLYTKSSARIQDFFGMIGENEAYFELMNARIERDIRNSVNRIATCESNNISKSVNAAAEQLAAIAYLADAQLLESLPPELAETARLRLAHRALSLSQLAAIAVPPISKPGLSHRLRRLVEIAREHREKSEKESKQTRP